MQCGLGFPAVFSACLMSWLAAPAALAAPLAVDATGCLHVVKTGPSGTCDAQSKSLRVDLANTCKVPVRAQICLRGANKLWTSCDAKDKLAPAEHFFGSSCDATGDYTYWGCTTVSGAARCGGDNLVGKASNKSN